MVRSLPSRLPRLLAATAAVAALNAAPALATAGPPAPPPGPPLPMGLTPPGFAPFTSPPPVRAQRARLIQRARLVHRRVRRGKHAVLRVRLTAPSRLRIVLTRRVRGRGIRTAALTVPARGRTVSVRLPARAHGKALRKGRYRIRVVAFDASGARSVPVRLGMKVRPRR